jgi:bleomycin hydrolase
MASDSWFEHYVFQAVVHKKYLGEKAALLEEKPIVLLPWDPMGSLAD